MAKMSSRSYMMKVKEEMTERLTILVADKVSETGMQLLLSDPHFDVIQAHGWEPEQFTEALGRAHALIVRSATKVTRELLEGADHLRVIGRAGVGVDNIDLDAATEKGIPVLNAPSGNTISAAELTFALILAVVRRIPSADRSVRAGEWTRSRFAGMELRGKTLALVGAGRIGGEVARRAQSFGMRTIAYDPYLVEERAAAIGLERVSFEEALQVADVLSLHVPLTASTEGMIGAEQLAAMKSSAFLINAARGGVVDEAALSKALVEGEIAGAALDVYAEEPIPDGSPLREAPNLVLAPHLGASTAEAQELVATEITAAVRAALLEGDLSRAVNAPAIGGEELRRLRPLMDLARKMGRLGSALARGGISQLQLKLAGGKGEALRPLSASALCGLLEQVVGPDEVNFVNAQHIAQERGISITASILPEKRAYHQYLELVVSADGGSIRVAGALLGEGHPRIVHLDGYEVSVFPGGTLLVLRNRDVPGVIGRVGTLLGKHELNIEAYHQAKGKGGREALAAISVDGEVSEALLRDLRATPEVEQVRVVDLG